MIRNKRMEEGGRKKEKERAGKKGQRKEVRESRAERMEKRKIDITKERYYEEKKQSRSSLDCFVMV